MASDHIAIASMPIRQAVADLTEAHPEDGNALEKLLQYLEQTRPTMSEIREAICELYLFERKELLGEARVVDVVRARQIFCWLAYRHTRLSTTQIGTHIQRDHSTVVHAIHKIEREAVTNPVLADDLDLLRMRIAEKILLRSHRGIA